MLSVGLNHVAMSFAPGTLTADFRSDVRSFYGELLGWTEIEELELTDRMTLATGGNTYITSASVIRRCRATGTNTSG